jgi:uncharacterized protein YndB with AHSA1/START domain
MEWTRSNLIRASVEQVWQLTVDIERWPEILPTVKKITRMDSGPLVVGSRALVEQPGFRAEWTVRSVEPNHRFVWATQWRGRALVAEHLVEPVDGGARNTLRLELEGPHSALINAVLGPLMRITLAREAKAFRRTAEALRATVAAQ